jgi:signal transduction histidine kinase
MELVTRDNRRISLEVKSSPVRRQGQVTGTLLIARDISRRREAEAERETLIKELEFKNAELERFTYTASHDLKSPLITIKGFLAMLERDSAAGDAGRVKADIARIGSAADKMKQLLDALLDLSRVGRPATHPEPLDFGMLAREAMELLAGPIGQHHAQVLLAPQLPIVRGDRLRLRELLQNLMENAIKFSCHRERVRIEIGSRRDNGEVVLYVKDNGIGIEPRHHERIFGLFDKLDPSATGTGVGLALVKQIVETHGGRIWVESQGRAAGACFCFTLPIAESSPCCEVSDRPPSKAQRAVA